MDDDELVTKEIHDSLSYCNFCTTKLGISFIDEPPSSFSGRLKATVYIVVSAAALLALIAGEFAYITILLISSSSVAEFVAGLHIVGYGCVSASKLATVWLKRHMFRSLVKELAEIWPRSMTAEEVEIKESSLKGLRFSQFWYMFFNIGGVVFYNFTPIGVYLYHQLSGSNAPLGYIWYVAYPFDKTKPYYHEIAYLFEGFAGTVSVWSMLSGDLMFTTMANHITLLLRLVQVKIRNLAKDKGAGSQTDPPGSGDLYNCYDEIVNVTKIHQRLITYTRDLEDVFSMVNLINVLLSSVNICCVVFNIVLLEPWMEMSNKLFLGAVLTQMGMVCWYADAIYRTSLGVSDAVYESGWYASNARCRRALLFLLQRSQKPLCFTALKFRDITMSTYSSILTTAYSYFALLYTMYNN